MICEMRQSIMPIQYCIYKFIRCIILYDMALYCMLVYDFYHCKKASCFIHSMLNISTFKVPLHNNLSLKI